MDLAKYQLGILKLLSIVAGVVFVYLSIYVIGVGAAIAVPESILRPMFTVSPMIALSLVDFVTIGIPVAICFILFTWLIKLVIKTINYYLLVIPFVVFMLYALTDPRITSDAFAYQTAMTFAKIIPVLICVLLLSKWVKNGNGA